MTRLETFEALAKMFALQDKDLLNSDEAKLFDLEVYLEEVVL